MRILKRTTIGASAAAAAIFLGACSGGGGAKVESVTAESGASGEDVTVSADCGNGKTMKLALNQTEEHPSYVALADFGTYLKENTDGWDIEVYPNETLGAQAEALQLVQDGAVDMAIVSGTQLENLNEDFVVFNLPKVFDSIDHQMAVIHDPAVVGDLYSSLESSNNVTVLGGFTQGTRSLYTSFEGVTTPADMAGKKIRVQESPLHIAMAGALGGAGTPMAYGELYSGLQAGVVDAAENNEVSYATQHHYEVAPYFYQTDHLVGLDYLIINSNLLDQMCQEERDAFDAGWKASHEQHTVLWEEATADAIQQAKDGGATFLEVDQEAFTVPLTALADDYIKTDDQKALYDAARAAAK